jgi:predicted DNA-binding protein (MmcQ/YjbR family)
MSLFGVAAFRRFALGLPGVTIVEQWGSHVAKVGGKVFALVGESGGDIVFKVSETSFEGLTSITNVEQAPYFAKRQWVSVHRGARLSDAELKAYLRTSYRMIAGKLTKKARAEIGIALEP